MPTHTPEPPAISEQEARRRLAAAYRILLDIAARRRAEAQNAESRNTADARTDHRNG